MLAADSVATARAELSRLQADSIVRAIGAGGTPAQAGSLPVGGAPWVPMQVGPVIIIPIPMPFPWAGQFLAPGAPASGAPAMVPAPPVRPDTSAVFPEAAAAAGVTPEDLAAMEERLANMLERSLERERRLNEEAARAEAERVVEQRTPAVTNVPEEPARVGDAANRSVETRRIRLDPSLGFPVRELRPYSGFGSGGGTQMLFGMAADWGPVRPGSRFDLIPEVVLGLGGAKPTWMAAANLQYRLGWVAERDRFWINPLVQVGAGLLNQDRTEAVLNLAYGASVGIDRRGSSRPLNLYLAHQGIDLFTRSRLIIGLSLER